MHYLIPFRPQDVTLYYAENTIYNGNHGYSINIKREKLLFQSKRGVLKLCLKMRSLKLLSTTDCDPTNNRYFIHD